MRYLLQYKVSHILENNYTTSGTMKNLAENYVLVGIQNTSGYAKRFAECEIDDILSRIVQTDRRLYLQKALLLEHWRMISLKRLVSFLTSPIVAI